MKVKVYLLVAILFGTFGIAHAQAQNEDCTTDFQLYVADAKSKNYDAAYEPWKRVFDKCPNHHYANYAFGEKILKHKIKKGENKEENTKLYLQLLDNSITAFPKRFKKGKQMATKAVFMKQNKLGSTEEIFGMLEKAFKEDKKNFTSPKAMLLYFSSLVDLHKSGKKELQNVFDTYDDLNEKIEAETNKLNASLPALLEKEEAGTPLTKKEKNALKRARVNGPTLNKILGSIETELGTLANCENLIPLYKKNYEAKKDNVRWVKRAVGRMYSKDCDNDPLFVQLVERQAELDPSAGSYFYVGLLKEKRNDTKGAIENYNKAVELETNSNKKADILYKIARNMEKRGIHSSAYKYANKAVASKASMGKAYMLMARVIAKNANKCGSTTFEKKAVYWKAESMARKAARMDPSIKGRANSAANRYKQLAPSRTEIFNSQMGGKTITFKCWIGGSVVVPKL
ncbi:MAG: hypothetical protein OIF50_01985 [Flavobacteriaceae bacterium]|nr:hypothetical protein [Flavobacteriaceae bacterium]